MSFWRELGKAVLEGMDTAAQAQNPAVQTKMKEHTIALSRLKRDSGTGGFAAILVESVASSAMMTTYLDKLPKKEVSILAIYLSEKARQAKTSSDEDRYDRDAEALASRLESLSEFVTHYVRNRESDE